MIEQPPKRKRRSNISPIDAIMARERSQMELQMRRNAVLQYVGEQLAELNAMLRQAGFQVAPQPPMQQQVPQPLPFMPQPQAAPIAAARPCAWCGKPGTPQNVGNGVIQDLCILHARVQRAEAQGPVDQDGQPMYTKAAQGGFSVNHTDARPGQASNLNVGKIIMQPTAADEQAATAHARDASGAPAPVPEGFEELEGGE